MPSSPAAAASPEALGRRDRGADVVVDLAPVLTDVSPA